MTEEEKGKKLVQEVNRLLEIKKQRRLYEERKKMEEEAKKIKRMLGLKPMSGRKMI